MNEVAAVIGASYGDEGKGHVTDYLSDSQCLVVRFNGGAQAGHTVVDPDGRRHIFHHFGSGCLRNAETFLSPYFIVNPIVFRKELDELSPKMHRPPMVVVDPLATVTTPFDMMLNQAAERKRDNRHGSCGIGINETVTRTEFSDDLKVNVKMARDGGWLHDKLDEILKYWVPRRMEVLGLEERDLPYLRSQAIRDRFMEDVGFFLGFTRIIPWEEIGSSAAYDRIIFEGAQGLRLDEYSPDFPHVTRSRTGLPNVVKLVRSAGIKVPIDAYYVTRPYVTRHGPGPLQHEMQPPFFFDDKTNVTNEWQGALRAGELDLPRLTTDIDEDASAAELHHEVVRHIALTCLDHVDSESIPVHIGRSRREISVATLMSVAATMAGTSGDLVFAGPTREGILTNFNAKRKVV